MSGMKNKYVIKMSENTTKQNKVQQDKSTNSKKVLARELLLNLSGEKKTEYLTVSRDLLYFKIPVYSQHTRCPALSFKLFIHSQNVTRRPSPFIHPHHCWGTCSREGRPSHAAQYDANTKKRAKSTNPTAVQLEQMLKYIGIDPEHD